MEDLGRLHALMQTRYGYTMTLARPPHYVDKMTGGFTSYDVYDRMGYQYMAASFDGAGWLPSTDPDPEAALQAEIRAMVLAVGAVDALAAVLPVAEQGTAGGGHLCADLVRAARSAAGTRRARAPCGFAACGIPSRRILRPAAAFSSRRPGFLPRP